MKAYLPVFDDGQITRKEMIKIIDRMPEVVDWHAVFGSSTCHASSLEGRVLASRLNRLLPDLRYIVTEVEPEQKGGRMPSSALQSLNAPHSAELEAARC